jgi:hypothetical protein
MDTVCAKLVEVVAEGLATVLSKPVMTPGGLESEGSLS